VGFGSTGCLCVEIIEFKEEHLFRVQGWGFSAFSLSFVDYQTGVQGKQHFPHHPANPASNFSTF